MSFGGSPGDIVTASILALQAYRACKAAAGDFAEVTREVSAVSIELKDLEDQAASPTFARNHADPQTQAKFRSIIDGIIYALRELEELATKYSSLSTAKKNNWDRCRFAVKKIDPIRARLAFHISAAQTILDGLINRAATRIEGKSDETNAALTRIEQVLADIVKEVKHGSRNTSTFSDEQWNIWTELRRELLVEGYPATIIKEHKKQIKQYLLGLVQSAGLEDEIDLEELDPVETLCSEDDIYSKEAQPDEITITQDDERIDDPDLFADEEIDINFSKPHFRAKAIQILRITAMIAIAIAFIPPMTFHGILLPTGFLTELVANMLYVQRFGNSASPRSIPTSTAEVTTFPKLSHTSTVTKNRDSTASDDVARIVLELKAGLFKNENPVSFGCANIYQAQTWIDQMSPLFDQELMDESAIRVRRLRMSPREEVLRDLLGESVKCPLDWPLPPDAEAKRER